MKTVESAHLYLRNETSDKVYEVDLCEVEDGLFIVNFRYGKRNTNLREGTKTVFPVNFEEAKRTYDQLVLDKTKKGYTHAGNELAERTPVETTTVESEDSIKIQKAIIRNLNDVRNGRYKKDWTTSRMIWKVGELRIKEAEAYVIDYLRSSEFQVQYAAVWALGRLKSLVSADKIYWLWKNTTSSPVKGLCTASLLGFENPYKRKIKDSIESILPSLLRDAILSKNRNSIKNGIDDFTQNATKETAALWINLYLISFDNEVLRALLQERFKGVSTRLNEFKAVRKIYKLAEFRDDYEFLAICAKKIAITPANYSSSAWGLWHEGQYVKVHEEKSKPDSILAFSSATKTYFNKRTFRILEKTLKSSSDSYIALATEILLSVDDKLDGQKEFKTEFYDYSSGEWGFVAQWHPKYHRHTAYNFILFDGSERLQLGTKNQSYSYKLGYVPDNKPIAKREEHNDSLWDNAPKAVCRILSHAKVLEVNDFALKVFNANPTFKDSLSNRHLALMASSIYQSTANRSLELINELFLGKTLPFELIIGLLSSPYEAVVNLGKDSLREYIDKGNLGTEDIIQIILIGQVRVLEMFENVELSDGHTTPIQFSQLAPIVFDTEKYNEDFFRALMKFASQNHVKTLFSEFSAVDIEQFIKAKENFLQEFGLLLIRLNKQPTHELALPILDTFLNSENHLLRAAAIELMAEFPDEFLLKKADMVREFVFSEHKELRESIVAVVEKLVTLNQQFRKNLFSSLLSKICEQEEIEGAHQDHLALLQNCFANELGSLELDMIVELLLSSVDAAQKLGEQQFHTQRLKQHLKLSDWAALKDADVVSIRAEIQHFYSQNVKDTMADLYEALKVLESKWADLRNWAMNFFLENSTDENWTLEQILQVADSPKEDVQSFARSLISKLFSSSHGKELMVHLSEHPSRSMMLFNSNYLNIYAKDNADVILQLKQYFKNILYGVNLGAASKARVFAFLMQELKKDEQVAKMTLDILSEILVTTAIGDKSNCIDLSLEIGELYPNLELPISVSPLNTYTNAIQP